MPSTPPSRDSVELGTVVKELWESAIAPSTRQAYQTGFNMFLQFLLMTGMISSVVYTDIQVSENMLIYFVAHCHRLKLAYTTIKLYLCGIRFMCLKHNIYYPVNASLTRMHTVLGGVKRICVKSTRPRYPITFDILKKVCGYLCIIPQSFEDLMLETACIVAFFGFLRCGEFTVNKPFDCHANLCVKDLVVTEECVLLHLKRSKTDPFREGVTLKLFKTNNTVCPYMASCKYLSARTRQISSQDDPLFAMDNGQALTRACFISKFKHVLECLGINSNFYNGHSFRIGAATSAAAANVEDHLIKVLGRWSSDAYCRYIRTSSSSVRDAQIALTLSKDLRNY